MWSNLDPIWSLRCPIWSNLTKWASKILQFGQGDFTAPIWSWSKFYPFGQLLFPIWSPTQWFQFGQVLVLTNLVILCTYVPVLLQFGQILVHTNLVILCTYVSVLLQFGQLTVNHFDPICGANLDKSWCIPIWSSFVHTSQYYSNLVS